MINIRKATVKDLQALSILFDQYRLFYRKTSDLQSANSFLKARIENDDSVIFVSFNSEGNMTGFTQLYPLFSSTRMKKLWLLNDLFVHPDYRGQGFSVALIEKAKQLCIETNACGMYLETETSNDIGNQLYPKTGFQFNDTSNFYYWDV